MDDSILCENPEDGMVSKVPTEDLKIRRYVEYLERFVVFYNDEILREIPFDDVSSEMVLERTGYYGFYVRDEEGILQNIGKFCANVILGCVIKDAEEDLSAWKDMIEKN